MSNYFKIVNFVQNFDDSKNPEEIFKINNENPEYDMTIILDKKYKDEYNVRLLQIDDDDHHHKHIQ